MASRISSFNAVVAVSPTSVNWGSMEESEVTSWTAENLDLPFVPLLSGFVEYVTAPGGVTIERYAKASLTSVTSLENSEAVANATIPVENISSPILLLGGSDDQIWPSCFYMDQITIRLKQNSHPFDDESYCYQGAGHSLPLAGNPTTNSLFPLDQSFKRFMDLGGNARDTAKAGEDAWPKIENFLSRTLKSK